MFCALKKKYSDFRNHPQNITFLGNKMKQYFNSTIMHPEIIYCWNKGLVLDKIRVLISNTELFCTVGKVYYNSRQRNKVDNVTGSGDKSCISVKGGLSYSSSVPLLYSQQSTAQVLWAQRTIDPAASCALQPACSPQALVWKSQDFITVKGLLKFSSY